MANRCATCGGEHAAGAEHCQPGGAGAAPTLSAAHAPPPPTRLPVGTMLEGVYRVGACIGEGAMGAVYEVEHVGLGKRFAAKVLGSFVAADPDAVLRLQNEARAASSIEHDNIVNVTHLGRTPKGSVFVVMELLQGEDLRARLVRQAAGDGPPWLPDDEACAIGEQLLAGLGAAHRVGVVHRDLKPENVLLARKSDRVVVKLVDFGISKLVTAPDKRLTGAGQVLGTPLYMSPEQGRAAAQVDARTDLYAAGVILYELTTGSVPFEGTSVAECLIQHATEPPPPPSSRRPDLPEAVEALILRCLAKRPEDRHRSADELREAWRSAWTEPPRDRAAVRSASHLPERDRELPSPEPREDRRPAVAVLPFENLTSDPSQGLFCDGLADDVITDLAKISGLLVVARGASFAYRGRDVDLRRVAHDLGVQFVLAGSVRMAAGRVRVSASLIDIATGAEIWADRFDRTLDDVFEVQDELTERIVSALDVQVLAGEQARIWRRSLRVPRAREHFYRGKSLLYGVTATANESAREAFERVIALEPSSPLGYAFAAATHWFRAFRRWSEDEVQDLARAEGLLREALALDPDSSDAHAILGQVLILQGRHDEAEVAARRAHELCPSGADVAAYLGLVLVWNGKPGEAVALLREAMRSCPLWPPIYGVFLGIAHRELRRFDEGIEILGQAAARHPDSVLVRYALVTVLSEAGRHDEARAEADRLASIDPSFSLGEHTRRLMFRDPTVRARLLASLAASRLTD